MGFSARCSNSVLQKADDAFAVEYDSSSSDSNSFDGQVRLPLTKPKDNDPLYETCGVESGEVDTIDIEQNIRKSSRHRAPNRKYVDDYISSMISPRLSPVALCSKRCLSSCSDTIGMNVKVNVTRRERKKAKRVLADLPVKKQCMTSNRPFIVVVGSFKLTWLRYDIMDGVYGNKSCSVTRMCPLDTGLFVLYFA